MIQFHSFSGLVYAHAHTHTFTTFFSHGLSCCRSVRYSFPSVYGIVAILDIGGTAATLHISDSARTEATDTVSDADVAEVTATDTVSNIASSNGDGIVTTDNASHTAVCEVLGIIATDTSNADIAEVTTPAVSDDDDIVATESASDDAHSCSGLAAKSRTSSGRIKRKYDKVNQCLSVSNFDNIIEATRSLCGVYDDPGGRPLFRIPSLGLKLGHSLKSCAEAKRGIAVRAGDYVTVQEADDFLSLHSSEWTSRVSSASLASLKYRKYNNPELLPLTSDLVKLKEYQTTQIALLSVKLEQSPSCGTWRSLMEQVYTRLVIFNKRRCGETAKLLLNAFLNRPRWEEAANDEIIHTLQPLERKLMQRFVTLFDFEYRIHKKMTELLTLRLMCAV